MAWLPRASSPSHAVTELAFARRSPMALILIVALHLGLLALLLSSHAITVPTPPRPLLMQLMPVAINPPKVAPRPEPRPPSTSTTPIRQTTALRTPARPAPTLPISASPLAAPDASHPEPASPAAAITNPATSATPVQSVAAPAPTPPRFDVDYFDNPVPTYPPLSRRNREAGRVVLHVFVQASGLPGKVEVYTSSGFERLDNAAIAAVLRWKFLPARQGNDTVAAWVLVPVDFSLQG